MKAMAIFTLGLFFYAVALCLWGVDFTIVGWARAIGGTVCMGLWAVCASSFERITK